MSYIHEYTVCSRKTYCHTFQIHERDEEEMNEKNDNVTCLNGESVITADQVCLYKQFLVLILKKIEAVCIMYQQHHGV